MEAICSSETSVTTQETTRRHIPEDDTLHNHLCENLKSYNLIHVCNGKIKSNIIFFSRIITAKPRIPDNISPEAADFILKLLVKNPQKRLGGGEDGAQELKRHPFFKVSFSPITFVIL
jgi:serine/threonine protein kinase